MNTFVCSTKVKQIWNQVKHDSILFRFMVNDPFKLVAVILEQEIVSKAPCLDQM